jgi:hypothetical protein
MLDTPGVDIALFRNTQYKPRVRFVEAAFVVSYAVRAAVTMIQGAAGYDPTRMVVIVADDALEETRRWRARWSAQVAAVKTPMTKMVGGGTTRVVISHQAPHSGYLVLADSYYPSWHVTVDGHRRPLLLADGFARAVYVEAGRHRVEFSYDPATFRVGLAISLLALGVLLLSAFVPPNKLNLKLS